MKTECRPVTAGTRKEIVVVCSDPRASESTARRKAQEDRLQLYAARTDRLADFLGDLDSPALAAAARHIAAGIRRVASEREAIGA